MTIDASSQPTVESIKPQRKPSYRFLVPLVLIGIGMVLVVSGFNFPEVRSRLESFGVWAPIVFVVIGVTALTVLVPKTVVSVSAGALFGTFTGGLAMLFIAVIAAALNYRIGRWWLHDSINQKLMDQSSDSRHQQWFRAIRDVAADGDFRFHFFIRLTPIPTTMISYAMGASGSRTRPFLLGAAAAVIPQLLWVHGGTAATLLEETSFPAVRWLTVIVSIVAGIAMSILVPRLAFRRIESMKSEQFVQ